MAGGAEDSAAAEADSRIDEDWERITITEEIAPEVDVLPMVATFPLAVHIIPLSHSAFRKLRKQVRKLGIAPLEMP